MKEMNVLPVGSSVRITHGPRTGQVASLEVAPWSEIVPNLHSRSEAILRIDETYFYLPPEYFVPAEQV